MKTRIVVLAILLLIASSASADTLKGFIWESSVSVIVVEGQAVRLVPETAITRTNHKDIAAKDLRVGWEVEVETRGDPTTGLTARRVKVKNARFQEEDIEGIIDGINHEKFFVDGDEILLKGPVPKELAAGMRFKGKGVRQDDRSIELKDGTVMPGGFVGEEAQFMAAASQEISKVREQLKTIKDPELQAYVDRVGRSLVPKWVDAQQFRFTFTLVEDPTLNAFAMPDGTVVVHSGLLAVLENEAQLATVLGHEIAHATHRHGYRGFKDQQKKQMWMGLGSLAAGIAVGAKTDSPLAGVAMGVGTNLAMQAMVNGHGRKLEDEADILGLYYMVEAGYDYMEAPEVWRVFGRYTKDQSKVSNFFFSNHSTHEARIKNLTREINTEYRTVSRDKLRLAEEEYQKVSQQVVQLNTAANLQNQEFARAGRSLAAALDRNPNDAKAHYDMGRLLWAQGQMANAQAALDEFGAAIQLDQNFALAWRDAGVVLFEARQVNHAAKAFERYLQLAPNAPEAPQIRAFLASLRP